MLICVVKIKYHCSFPREEADMQAGKLSWGTTRLKQKQGLSPKDTDSGGSREGLCSQTGFLIQEKASTLFSVPRKEKSLHGTSVSGEKRPSSVCGGLEIGEVAQGGTLLFQLSAVSLVLTKLLSTCILPEGSF